MLATLCGYQGHLLGRLSSHAGVVDSETLMAQGLLQPMEASEAAVNQLLPCGPRAPLRSLFCTLSETDLS